MLSRMFYRRKTSFAMVVTVLVLAAMVVPSIAAVSRVGSVLLLEAAIDASKPHATIAVHALTLGELLEKDDVGDLASLLGGYTSIIEAMRDSGLEPDVRYHVVIPGYLAVEPKEAPLESFPPPLTTAEIAIREGDNVREMMLIPITIVILEPELELEDLGIEVPAGREPQPWGGEGPVEVIVSMDSFLKGAALQVIEDSWLATELGLEPVGSFTTTLGTQLVSPWTVSGLPVAENSLMIAYSPDPLELASEIIMASLRLGGGGDAEESLAIAPGVYILPLGYFKSENVIVERYWERMGFGHVSTVIQLNYRAEEALDTVLSGDANIEAQRVVDRVEEAARSIGYCVAYVEIQSIRGFEIDNRVDVEDCVRVFVVLKELPSGEEFFAANMNSLLMFSGVVILLATVAAVSSSELLSIALGDLRPWMAVVLARGASAAMLRRALIYSMAAAALVALVASMALSAATAPALISVATGREGLLDAGDIIRDRNAWLVSTGMVALVALASILPRLWEIPRISPVEAVRRVESVEAAQKGRRARASIILLGLAVASTLMGFVGDIESIIEWSARNLGPILTVPLVILMVIALFFSPLAPSMLAFYSSAVVSRAAGLYSRVAFAMAGLVSRELAPLVSTSSFRLMERLHSNSRSLVLAFSAVTALALTSSMLDPIGLRLEEFGASYTIDVSRLEVSLTAVENMVKASTPLAIGVFLVVAYNSVASSIGLIQREIVMLRARGASTRDALRFVYGTVAPVIAYSLAAGLAVGVVTAYSIVSGVKLFMSLDEPALAGELPNPPPIPGILEALAVLAPAGLSLLLPALVSLRAFGGGRLAEALREPP